MPQTSPMKWILISYMIMLNNLISLSIFNKINLIINPKIFLNQNFMKWKW